jgi:aspartate dehydrogenase
MNATQERKMMAAIIGCGFIGETLAKAIDKEMSDRMELVALYDQFKDRATQLSQALDARPKVVEDLSDIIFDKKVDLVIEAASQAAVKAHILKVLAAGKNVMIVSVGALADERLLSEVMATAREKKVKVYIPSGAIGGLDWIKAASDAGLEKVVITVRKPPLGLEGSPYVVKNRIDLHAIEKPTQIYEGPAAEAASAFPANVNVAVALSLAGIGTERTMVRVVADPTVKRNIHEIEAEGPVGKIAIRIENVPSPTNPKTSWVAALSAIRKLKELAEPVSLG